MWNQSHRSHDNAICAVPLQLLLFAVVFATPLGLAWASDNSAQIKGLLQKMIKAERSVNFRGTFVYRHNDEMVAMKIVRAKGEHGMREHLVSLNGATGEVVRHPHRVKCLVPNSAHPLIYDSIQPVDNGDGYDGLMSRIDEINNYYRLKVVGLERIAQRMAHKILITPKDEHRYGYQIWVDQQSGLVLRSEHLSPDGSVLEQMIYTGIELFGNSIPGDVTQLFATHSVGSRPVQVGSKKRQGDTAGNNNWAVNYIPNGFALANYRSQSESPQATFEHIVFSDGLASVSVFIERKDGHRSFSGVSQHGAMNAYLSTVDDYQVVVVGEVPLQTLEQIGDSVRHTSTLVH